MSKYSDSQRGRAIYWSALHQPRSADRMIIDVHGHTNTPPTLFAYKSGLLASRGAHGKGNTWLNEEQLAPVVNNHVKNVLDKVGTDIQFLSPRPFQMMHSEKPARIVHWFAEMSNNAIAQTLKIAPER